MGSIVQSNIIINDSQRQSTKQSDTSSFQPLKQILRPITMTSQDYKWEGWVGHDADSAKGNMVWTEFTPKTWEETDVDIKITHSGICGTGSAHRP